MKHLLLSCETVLPDDYPIYGGYVYICDMKFFRCNNFIKASVADLKEACGFKEIRKCDIYGHKQAKLGDKLTKDL